MGTVSKALLCFLCICFSLPAPAKEPPKTTSGEPVKASGNRFMRDGTEVVLNGINYFPAYFPPQFPASWLGARRYRPEVIEKDLTAIAGLGLNLVSIPGLGDDTAVSPQDCANVRDFLGRAQSHGLLVNLYVGRGSLMPIPDPSRLAVIPRNCALAGHPALFAYDITWEPHFGREARRSALQPRWLAWLESGYGSLARADDAFGDGHALPSDRELCAAGPSVRVAALRRFLDEVLSASYRAVRAAIRAADDTHLIGARSGYGGNGSEAQCPDAPVDLRAGAKHLDFISPEAYALPKTDKAGLLARGGLTGAYADVGKPVFWAEFGVNVDGSCAYCTESVQSDFFAGMYELMRKTSANGGAGWWFVGTRPQSPADTERSDYGIARDDAKSRTLRPVAHVLKNALFGVSAARRNYAASILVDRDAAAGDWAMYRSGTEAYSAAARSGQLVGVRTSCSGTTSREVKLCVGNTPYDGACPVKCLNSEWNSIQIMDAAGVWRIVADRDEIAVREGSPVRAKLTAGNTGEGKWLARDAVGAITGSVRFGCNENAGDIGCRHDLESNVESLNDASSGDFLVSSGVTKKTKVVFQMLSEGIAWFGGRISVTLLPK
jgi:hypothetical protein